MPTIYYLRIITYQQALEVVSKARELGAKAEITQGGVCIDSSEENMLIITDFIEEKGWSLIEVTFTDPLKILDNISKNINK